MQAKLNTSIGNEYLLRMFALGESLVYYVNAIEANGGCLTPPPGGGGADRLLAGRDAAPG